jgi:hypothetical protein
MFVFRRPSMIVVLSLSIETACRAAEVGSVDVLELEAEILGHRLGHR